MAGFPPGVTRAGLWGAAGLALGAVCAALPPAYSALVLGGAALLAVSVWEPAVGVGAALVLGPSRAYLAAAGYFGPQFDLGQIFFALALAGWLARGALRREIVIPPLGLYLPLAGWIVIGLLSLFGAPAWQDGLNEAIKWIEVAVLIALVRAEAQRGRAGWIVGAVLLAGALQAGLGLWQFGLRGAGPASFQLPDGHFRAYGTFEQPNPFGGFLGLIWPVAAGLAGGWRPAGPAGGWRRWALPAVGALTAGLLLAGLYASFSRGAWLGAGAAALVLVLAWPRRRAVGLALAAGGLAGAGLLAAAGLLPASVTARLASVVDFAAVTDVRGAHITDANFALVERLAHWQAALGMIEARPWLGVGLGNYSVAYADYQLVNWPNSLGHAHNIYLHTWAETGALGLAAYGVFWGIVVILTLRLTRRQTGWRRGLAVGLLGVWAHLLTHQLVDNLHVNNNDLLLGAYLGLMYALNINGQHPRG